MGGTLTVWRGDITTMEVDAVVNAANEGLKGGGGVDGAIHRAAGPGLMEECRRIGGCETGQSVVTDAYDLPARYVIHTVGPVWRGGAAGEAELLASCYRTALEKAMDRGCDSVAVPAISTGVYGYPEAQAAAIAVRTVREVQAARDDAPDVTLVAYSKGAEAVLRAALAETGG